MFSSRAPIGYVAIAAAEMATNQGFKSFVPRQGLNSEFLYYYLQRARSLALKLASGTTFPEISGRQAARIPLPVAPSAEQLRLVEAVESYLARLDTAEATLERVKRNLQRYRASVLQAAVEGRLVPTEAEGAGKAKWRIEPAQAVCTHVVSGSTPLASKMAANSGEVPFIKVYNLTMTGELDFTIKPTYITREAHEGQLRRSRVRPGDVLTNIVGPPLGKVSVVSNEHPEWNVNQAIAAFRPGTRLSTEWLRIVLQADSTRRWLLRTAKTTTSQVNLAITTCRRLPIPLPPRTDQDLIVAEVDRLLSIGETIKKVVTARESGLARLRQSILKWAFEGRLVEQDPADEPAAVLLERIRAERQSGAKASRRGSRGRRARSAVASGPPAGDPAGAA